MAASLKADSIKAMRALPAEDLQKATGQGLSFLGPLLGVVVDGWVVPKPSFEVFEGGQGHRVDLLLGTNARELTRPFFPVAGLDEGIRAQYGPLASRALNVYGLKDGKEPPPDPVYGAAMAQWATDSQFRCGTVAELIWHSRAGNKSVSIWSFPVSRQAGNRSEPPMGASCLMSLVRSWLAGRGGTAFSGTMRRTPLFPSRCSNTGRTSPKLATLTEVLCPQWPKFDPTARAYMDLTGNGPVAREGLRRKACDLFIENIARQ